ETAAAILWLSPIHSWKEMEPKPKPAKWVRQVARMKMFDNFICNKDRNAGNLMVDDDWNLYLIDQSRAFIWDKDMAVKMEHIDRAIDVLHLDRHVLVPDKRPRLIDQIEVPVIVHHQIARVAILVADEIVEHLHAGDLSNPLRRLGFG